MTQAADPKSATSLRRLELVVTRRLDGMLVGDYQGFLQGPGSHPAGGRVYEPGDDVRHLDWNLTARMAEPHVRTTEADRELTTWVVVDGSASLDFGTAACEKRDLAVAAVAAVGFLTARSGNRTGGIVTGGPDLEVVPPRSGAASVHRLLRLVSERPRRDATPPGVVATTVAGALGRLDRVGVRRGLVAVVSDFHETGWQLPMRRVSLHHQVLAAVTSDPREATLPAAGFLTLVDPETGRRVEVQTSSARLRQRYEAAAAAQSAAVLKGLRAAGASVVELSTDRDWLLDVVRFVAAGRRQRAGLSKVVTR